MGGWLAAQGNGSSLPSSNFDIDSIIAQGRARRERREAAAREAAEKRASQARIASIIKAQEAAANPEPNRNSWFRRLDRALTMTPVSKWLVGDEDHHYGVVTDIVPRTFDEASDLLSMDTVRALVDIPIGIGRDIQNTAEYVTGLGDGQDAYSKSDNAAHDQAKDVWDAYWEQYVRPYQDEGAVGGTKRIFRESSEHPLGPMLDLASLRFGMGAVSGRAALRSATLISVGSASIKARRAAEKSGMEHVSVPESVLAEERSAVEAARQAEIDGTEYDGPVSPLTDWLANESAARGGRGNRAGRRIEGNDTEVLLPRQRRALTKVGQRDRDSDDRPFDPERIDAQSFSYGPLSVNSSARARQQMVDAISEAFPDAPFIGADKRKARRTRSIERDAARAAKKNQVPLAEAMLTSAGIDLGESKWGKFIPSRLVQSPMRALRKDPELAALAMARLQGIGTEDWLAMLERERDWLKSVSDSGTEVDELMAAHEALDRMRQDGYFRDIDPEGDEFSPVQDPTDAAVQTYNAALRSGRSTGEAQNLEAAAGERRRIAEMTGKLIPQNGGFRGLSQAIDKANARVREGKIKSAGQSIRASVQRNQGTRAEASRRAEQVWGEVDDLESRARVERLIAEGAEEIARGVDPDVVLDRLSGRAWAVDPANRALALSSLEIRIGVLAEVIKSGKVLDKSFDGVIETLRKVAEGTQSMYEEGMRSVGKDAAPDGAAVRRTQGQTGRVRPESDDEIMGSAASAWSASDIELRDRGDHRNVTDPTGMSPYEAINHVEINEALRRHDNDLESLRKKDPELAAAIEHLDEAIARSGEVPAGTIVYRTAGRKEAEAIDSRTREDNRFVATAGDSEAADYMRGAQISDAEGKVARYGIEYELDDKAPIVMEYTSAATIRDAAASGRHAVAEYLDELFEEMDDANGWNQDWPDDAMEQYLAVREVAEELAHDIEAVRVGEGHRALDVVEAGDRSVLNYMPFENEYLFPRGSNIHRSADGGAEMSLPVDRPRGRRHIGAWENGETPVHVPHVIDRSTPAGVKINAHLKTSAGGPKQNKRRSGLLFQYGLEVLDPKVMTNIYRSYEQWMVGMKKWDTLQSSMRPIPENGDIPKGWVEVDSQHVGAFVKRTKELLEEELPAVVGETFPHEQVQEMLIGQLERSMGPNGLMVPKALKKEIMDRSSLREYEWLRPTIDAFDRIIGAWRFATLNLRPAWLVNNIVGQTVLLAMSHGIVNSVRTSITIMRDPELRELLKEHSGGVDMSSSARVLTGETTGLLRASDENIMRELKDVDEDTDMSRLNAQYKAMKSLAGTAKDLTDGTFNYGARLARAMGDFASAVSDDPFRRAAMYMELKPYIKMMQDADPNLSSRDAATRLLDDPRIIERVEQNVLGDLVDFGNMNTMEREMMRRAAPFYSWLKGMTKRTGQFAYENPIHTNATIQLSQEARDRQEESLGDVPNFMRGGILAGDAPGVNRMLDFRGTPMFVTQGLNPLQTPADVYSQAASMFRPGTPVGGDSPVANLNPLLKIAIQTPSGRDMFTGESLDPTGQKSIARNMFDQAAMSSPIPQSLHRYFTRTGEGDEDLNDSALFRTSGRGELLKWLGVPVRDVNLDTAREYGSAPRQFQVIEVPDTEEGGYFVGPDGVGYMMIPTRVHN